MGCFQGRLSLLGAQGCLEREESEGRRGQPDFHQRKPPRVPDKVPPLPPTKRPHPQSQWLLAGDCFRLTCTLFENAAYIPSEESAERPSCPHSVMLWPRGSFQDAPSSCRHVQGARQAQTTCSHVRPRALSHSTTCWLVSLCDSLCSWFVFPHCVEGREWEV